jgi:2-methylisocitrate lyase-like PEP mutase family enzyme
VEELAVVGVARISLGSAIAHAAYKVAELAAREILSTGTYGSLQHAVGFQALNSMLAPSVPSTA